MGRAPCCNKKGLKKGPWTTEEDQMLVDYIQKHGHGNWRTLPKNAKLARCGKSCRIRWTNYLRPDIKRGRFSFEEEETIIQLHSILGNKWSAIAARLPGRTDNEIKNYWNTSIRKRLLRLGIDPVTHSPRLDHLLNLSSFLGLSLYNPAQFEVSRYIGIEPLVNSHLLTLAASLLSSSHNQGLAEQLFSNPQVQNPIHDGEQLSEVQMHVQSNLGQHCGFTPENFMESSTDFGYLNVEQYVDHMFSDNPNFDTAPINKDYNLIPSILSTPVWSSPEHLYSSSISNSSYVLYTPTTSPNHLIDSSSTVYFNSSTDDEKGIYCSELFKFQIPYLLGETSDFM